MNDTFHPIISKLHLRFFDVAVTVASDSRQFIESFGLVFQRFFVNAPHEHEFVGCLIECAVLTNRSNEWGRPVIIVDHEVFPVHNQSFMEGYACEKIIIAAFSKVRSHFLAHAGVVSHHGEGVVIIADAEHGKTTLTLELVKRGFTFLSDEVAALGRRDHRVYPFPRSLRIRVARRNSWVIRRSCPRVPYGWVSTRSIWRHSSRTALERPRRLAL